MFITVGPYNFFCSNALMYSKIIQNHTVNVFPSFLWFVVNVRSFEMDSLQSTLFYSTTKVNRFVWMCSKMSKASKITLWMLFFLNLYRLCNVSLFLPVKMSLLCSIPQQKQNVCFNQFQWIPKCPKASKTTLWMLLMPEIFIFVFFGKWSSLLAPLKMSLPWFIPQQKQNVVFICSKAYKITILMLFDA